MTPEQAGEPEQTSEASVAETDPRFPSGKWGGFWIQKILQPGRWPQEMQLSFHKGVIAGEGRDRIGAFLIRGFYSTEDGRCRWTKRYVGMHDVYYQGFNEGKGIWGTWSIDLNHGGFHIWPEGMSDPSNATLEAEADVPAEVPASVGEVVAAG
jgi:hypothetical protein